MWAKGKQDGKERGGAAAESERRTQRNKEGTSSLGLPAAARPNRSGGARPAGQGPGWKFSWHPRAEGLGSVCCTHSGRSGQFHYRSCPGQGMAIGQDYPLSQGVSGDGLAHHVPSEHLHKWRRWGFNWRPSICKARARGAWRREEGLDRAG